MTFEDLIKIVTFTRENDGAVVSSGDLLIEDLNLSPMDIAEILSHIDDTYDIKFTKADAHKLNEDMSVRDFWELIQSKLK